MKRLKTIAQWTGLLLCLLGCVWFCLPVFRSAFGIGSALGIFICLAGAGLIKFYGPLVKGGSRQRIAVRVVLVGYLLGLAWCGYLTGLMVSVQLLTPPPGTPVIVLGAQIHAEDRLSLSLSARVNRAAEYLSENPEVPCIVTGGQGGDEPCPEAEAMARALIRQGVEEERIFIEPQARNTRENMLYSAQIAEENGLGAQFVLVTQSFHMYRSMQLAKAAGLTPYTLAAHTDWLMFPQYYGRELLSLTKWTVERWFLE